MQIRESLPDAAIGADVMVGFPGETDALFEESLAFIAAQPFTYLHLFPFSPRPGTGAWQLAQAHPLPLGVVNQRMTRLRTLIEERNRAFRQRLVGRMMAAVTLQSAPGASGRALTENFLDVSLSGEANANQNVRVRITGLTGDGVSATLVA